MWTYREDVHLFTDGDTVLSQEGTTQRNPLAMAMYAVAITQEPWKWCQHVWIADYATAVEASLDSDLLVEKGPDFGYHPNPLKTNLVVRKESAKNAKEVIKGTNISIT